MKKMTKLLSVILAFVMALSCMTMMSSAAKAKYQKVLDLEANAAYSPYGTVTRLSTEERVSILLDFLDQTLAPMTSLNMGKVIDNIMGLNLTINLTSVDAIFTTIDDVCNLKANTIYSIAAAFVNLGIVEDLAVKSGTNWTKGMTRAGSAQLDMINNLLKLLSTNSSVVNKVLTNGIELGMIANFISGLDLKPINQVVVDLPKLINAIVLPLMSRQDDTGAQRTTLSNTGSSLINVAQSFVNGLFTKPMNWTSYRVDGSGNDLGFTTALPTATPGAETSATSTRYFVINGDKITQYDYQYAGALGDPKGGVWVETVTYTKEANEEYAGSNTYLFKAPEDYDGDSTLKWYKAEGVEDNNGNIQSGYWLPTVKAAFESGDLTLAINGTDSVAGLLYKFAPYLFAEMAPIVLNGSVKKAVAEAFDVTFEFIGKKGDAGLPSGEFFTKAQEYYTWEYSDYAVIDGVPYYRFQDEFYQGSIPKNISDFYGMINWDYKIPGNFMDKYIPDSVGATSAAGYTHVLDALNDFVGDLINLFIADSWTVKGKTVTRAEVFPWVAGGNDKAIENLKVCARNVFALAPDEIVDEFVESAQFYNAMMNGTTKQAVNGLVCELVKLIMPQIIFADNIVDQPITAIAAVVVRELCTQLMPTYNFDAMIFAEYGDGASADRALLAGKSADYWLDTTLYMGLNLGMYYLRNIADVGEDDATNGYYGAMKNLGVIPSASGDAMTFGANAQYVSGTAAWLYQVDWVIDWALATNVEWAWQFEKLIDCGSTVNLATYQNPFNKLDTILLGLLPVDQLLNASGLAGTTYGSGTFVEKILKDGLVDSIVNLDLDKLQGCLEVPAGYFTQGNIADSLVKIVVSLLDKVLYKVAGNTDLINKTKITTVSAVLNHANIKEVVVNLVSKLQAASQTYNVLQPVMPILNFFVGWTTDPQKYADPQIYFTNDWGSTYLKSDNNPTLKITNTASGMLLKHRNSAITDSAYTITIKNVSLSDGVTLTNAWNGDIVVEPGETTDIPVTVPSTKTVTKAVITYTFRGKDGQPLGGNQTKIAYAYISDVADQLNENVDAADTGDYATREAYKKYYFTQNIYKDVTEYGAGVSFKPATLETIFATKSIAFKSITAPDSNKDMNTLAKTYFQYRTTQADAGWPSTLYSPSQNKSPTTATGKLFKAKLGVTEDTFSPENSEANNLYGVYDMGQYAVKYGNKSATWEFDFIYYTDYAIGNVKDQYVGYALQAKDFADQNAYNTYETALRNVITLSDVAKRTDYVSTIQPQIPAAIEALEDAYRALMDTASSSSSSTGDVSRINDKLESIETRPDGNDWNFQDYKLFEYFKYEDQRTNSRSMISSVKGPQEPQGYIPYEDASYDLIQEIKATQNSYIAAGIENTVVNPTSEDMENYRIALENFTPATYTDLQVDDQIAKLQFYYDIMVANSKTVDKDFLNKEIAYAENQNYDSSLYSADSWNRYVEALAAAKDASKSTTMLESQVFDAKYELMVAQTQLRETYKSMKESGYMNEELIPLIEHAQAIIANYGDIYSVVDGITEAEAFGDLVWALGVAYDLDNDGERDGILYGRSALTFQAYDRTASVKNKRAVDVTADNLRAAIENFTANAQLESNNPAETTVDQTIRFIQGIVPGSINSSAKLLSRVTITGITGATAVPTASKAGNYGTGAKVEIKKNDILLATYFVVIYGDVNGDGAVDAFDAIEVDMANSSAYYMGDVYDDAADLTNDGKVDTSDYAALVAGITCVGAINQNPTNA